MDSIVERVLCIDDDKDVLIFLKTVLENSGFEFIEASTAKAAIKKFKKEKPDIVIVDLMMEEVDSGIRLSSEIRKLNMDIPIYMLSSVGDALYNSIDTSEVGFSGVLQKPIKPESLLDIINAGF
jgi:DNA-binding response OmpR family regulator